jgi:hypothetical protein
VVTTVTTGVEAAAVDDHVSTPVDRDELPGTARRLAVYEETHSPGLVARHGRHPSAPGDT